MSKSLRWLEDRRLITRHRAARERVIRIHHESGSGEPYSRPVGRTDEERYLNLPHEYFLGGWHRQLSANGKTVLLIAHTLKPEFELNQRRGPAWWGVSTDTLGRGLIELRQAGVLHMRTVTRKAPETRAGAVTVAQYRLLEPFTRAAARESESEGATGGGA